MDFLLTTYLYLLVHVIIECPHRQCQCGRSLVLERIINGQSVMNPGTYPWQALLIVNGRFTVCMHYGLSSFSGSSSEATPKALKSLVCTIQWRRNREAPGLTIFNLAVKNVY